MDITMVGTGYLGATHAACMAELGHRVIGIDTDATKVEALNSGRSPFYEPGLDELLAKHTTTGRLRFTTDPAAASAARLHFLGVGTPQHPGSDEADLSALHAAVASLVPHLEGEHTLVGKSTVPVGTARALAATLPPTITLLWNPEFLREGHAVADTLRPDRIVIGGDGDILDELYAPLGRPIIHTDWETAELVKGAANALLATKVSFINGVATMCDAVGANITELSRALGLDHRIGPHFLAAGLGYGGGCLPKDTRSFRHQAASLGAESTAHLLQAVDAINTERRTRVIDQIRALQPQRVAILGAAFKPGSDDVRDSPGLAIAAALDCDVAVADPLAPGYLDVDCALDGADVVVLATAWPDYVNLDPEWAKKKVRSPRIIDGRYALDATAWRQAGWIVM
ncbi:UDP-glucose 6-dehydrogenase [Corynebacterium sp. 13CS0277]|uniref:UDP-glucose dehydrogenase family protein n=1 Tax=Corynebacterium sp. 13CS0277 TaxID=2071994 RepID=UPI000D02D470|nr:UDP-glucose/GDP-mannose dehydrogenase family protein [Corynebacterium sp. 13CS0277]PRQ11828.1 UDP-glucose 6-dehydrogenase [Corynebacterium sp. 13CS0277]